MRRLDSTRALLVGLFAAGLFYALLVVLEGRLDIGIALAIVIEIILLIGSVVTGTVNKKGLLFLILSVAIYLIFTLLFGVFSEIVVMAAGGIAVFAALKSEPKFPLTKRAIGTGLVVGVIMTFFGIYLALKIGIVYFVGAELLGFLILSMYGRYTPEENTIVVAIANSSSMISIGVLIIFPAIAIFGPTLDPPLNPDLMITYEFVAVVTALSALFGILLLAPFREQFEDYPWPQVVPQAECINSLGGDVTARRNVVTGLIASGIWVGATKILEVSMGRRLASIPSAFLPDALAFPDWIGVSNSPLMAAIGFFVGWKRVLVMATGSLISLIVWILVEGAAFIPYSDHLTRPEILYLAMGVFVAVILGDVVSTKDDAEPGDKTNESDRERKGQVVAPLFRITSQERVKKELISFEVMKQEIRDIASDPRGYLVSKRGKVPPWIAVVSLILFIITGTIIFSIIVPFVDLAVPWPLFVFGGPLTLVSAYFTARAISETGLLAGYISDMIAIPAIILLNVSFQAITTFMSMLGGLQDAALALLIHLKLGKMTGVRGRTIFKGVLIGGLLGTVVGSAITVMLYRTYGFGGTEFPAPTAQIFGFLVISLADLTKFQLPGLKSFSDVHPLLAFGYLIIFGAVGFLAGRGLNIRGWSSISLAVGLLVPPSTTVVMLIGGFIDYRFKKRKEQAGEDSDKIVSCDYKYERTSRVLSGIIAGETIVTVIAVLLIAFTTIF
ncbi:MAG: OPT/YSL family transporter [Candidatus Thorarchaeota archaeon]